jgi:hypothetical protein
LAGAAAGQLKIDPELMDAPVDPRDPDIQTTKTGGGTGLPTTEELNAGVGAPPTSEVTIETILGSGENPNGVLSGNVGVDLGTPVPAAPPAPVVAAVDDPTAPAPVVPGQIVINPEIVNAPPPPEPVAPPPPPPAAPPPPGTLNIDLSMPNAADITPVSPPGSFLPWYGWDTQTGYKIYSVDEYMTLALYGRASRTRVRK